MSIWTNYSLIRRTVEDAAVAARRERDHDSMFRRSVDYFNSTEAGKRAIHDAAKTYPLCEKIRLDRATPNNASLSLLDALAQRHSAREFVSSPLGFDILSALITNSAVFRQPDQEDVFYGTRPYPAAGALYTVETYIIFMNVDKYKTSICHVDPLKWELSLIVSDLSRDELEHCFGLTEPWSRTASAVIVNTIVIERALMKYCGRGMRFAQIEVGALGQTFLLAATALGLHTVMWGGYYDSEVEGLLQLDGAIEIVSSVILVGKNPHREGDHG